jgi:hypothetical protein
MNVSEKMAREWVGKVVRYRKGIVTATSHMNPQEDMTVLDVIHDSRKVPRLMCVYFSSRPQVLLTCQTDSPELTLEFVETSSDVPFAPEFKKGDIAQLKSGSANLRVLDVRSGIVFCRLDHDPRELQWSELWPHALKKIG